MSGEEIDSDQDEGPFDFALLGIVEKPCKDDIKHKYSQEDPQSAAEGLESSSEEECSSEEEYHAAASAKKRVRRTVKPKAKGRRKQPAAAASSGEHTCPHCQKKCISNSELQRHVRVHTGEKPFLCDQCEKGFGKKSNLYVDLFLICMIGFEFDSVGSCTRMLGLECY
jgi:hypothetical protein